MSRPAPRVVILCGDPVPTEIAELRTLGDVRIVGEAGLPAALPGADALFVWDFRSGAVANAWPEKDAETPAWVHMASAGVDRIMFPALVESPVTLTNSRGVFDEPMAEYVLGLVLCFAKGFPETVRRQDRRSWRHRVTERVAGRHAMVVGTGPIGVAIGEQLGRAGLRVRWAGRTEREDPRLGPVVASDALAEAVGDTDYLVIAAPLTDATRGLVDAELLRALPPRARLINVGRGESVIQDDLVAALRDGVIAGAALDVFEAEPLPDDSPLWDMPQVIVSPHMSGDADGYHAQLAALFADNLERFTDGRPLRNVVDKRRGYVSASPSSTVTS
ncbi:MAG: D-2-hydroxyacid dehydrogenase [Streptosporangiales bacterium]|nr:D-2-hydroxyacid dehydrogenase [Streptosporangiales bacterium]